MQVANHSVVSVRHDRSDQVGIDRDNMPSARAAGDVLDGPLMAQTMHNSG